MSSSTRSRGLNPRVGILCAERGKARVALQPPDHPAGHNQQKRNQLRPSHYAAKDFAASGIVAQEFDEVAFDSVKDHEAGPNLSVEFLAPQHPCQQHKIEKLGGSFDQLRRLNPDAKWSSTDGIRQRIREDDAPEMIRRFAVAAARRETAEASEDMSKG